MALKVISLKPFPAYTHPQIFVGLERALKDEKNLQLEQYLDLTGRELKDLGRELPNDIEISFPVTHLVFVQIVYSATLRSNKVFVVRAMKIRERKIKARKPARK